MHQRGTSEILVVIAVSVASAALAGAVVAMIIEGDLDATTASAVAAIVLAALTLYYAVEASRTRSQQAQQWNEEIADRRQQRAAQEANQRRQQSLAAARRMLDEFSEVGFGGLLRSPNVDDAEAFSRVERAIEANEFELNDEELRERVAVCRLVAFTIRWPDKEFASSGRNGKGFALLLARQVVQATRDSLAAHVGGRTLPGWDNLPRRPNAQAWLVNSGRAWKNVLEANG